MWPAAKRGLHINGLSPPNGPSTPLVRKLADKVLHRAAAVRGLGGRGHLAARTGCCFARVPHRDRRKEERRHTRDRANQHDSDHRACRYPSRGLGPHRPDNPHPPSRTLARTWTIPFITERGLRDSAALATRSALPSRPLPPARSLPHIDVDCAESRGSPYEGAASPYIRP